MNTGISQRALFFVWLIFIGTLPLELPVAYAAHGLLKPLIGELYQAFFAGSIGLILTSALLLTRESQGNHATGFVPARYAVMTTLYLSVGALAVVSTGIGVTVEYWSSMRQLLLGFLLPSLVGLQVCLLEEDARRRVWLAFYGGWVFLFLLSLFFLYRSYAIGLGENPVLASLPLTQSIFYWRYTFGEPWNIYGQFMGNANKISNYILIFMFLSVRFLGDTTIRRSRLTRVVFFAYWILGTGTLLILFSRAALMLLPFAIFFSGAYRYWTRRGILTTLLAIAATLAILPFQFGTMTDVFSYLVLGKYFDSEGDPLGTFVGRFDQWEDIWSYLTEHPGVIFTGLGTGGYGKVFFDGDLERGTHNTFLDTLMESGLTGFVALAVLLLFMLYLTIDTRRLALRDSLCFATIVALLMLMFREHSFSYLNVTSLGGICMTALFVALSVRSGSEPVRAMQRRSVGSLAALSMRSH